MPELPEVETVRRGLNRLIVGKTIKAVAHDTPKNFPNAQGDVDEFLIGATVVGVRRRAKVILIDLSSDYTLVVHLKMTGQMVYVGQHEQQWGAGHPNDSLVGHLPDKSTRVTIEFTDDSRLYFNDFRKFGWVKLYATIEVPNIDFMRRVGPEPLEDDFTATQFEERFARRRRTSIKAALLDQTVVAGVGNIYADEALWSAHIHPARLVGSLSQDELHKLYTQVRAVMNLSIEKGGSSNSTYRDAEGNKGSYMQFANVFRREGQPCVRHADVVIQKSRVAGRGTHTCPACQPEPEKAL
ncbi:MAG TPA: bifunctional DNA-formamidopyrimidine glycosylase/DNA-(apurinic or apyrimidinic site) lyase [Candidatus Saccharimonadales bacterium]|jgi:formamidopyrimidine-DNA glycosylase